MATLKVLHFPDKRLRKKALPVETIGEDTRKLAQDMLETMYANNGIGLAATQVNIQKRLVVIDLSEDRNKPIYLINPEILASSGTFKSPEGCLSVPEYYGKVDRAEKITYRYRNLDGEVLEDQTEGLLCYCIQHEIDHLDGKLFIDYLSPIKKSLLYKKIDKKAKFQTPAL